MEQIVRFPIGSRVIVAFGRAILAWRGAADDPHLRAVERCLS